MRITSHPILDFERKGKIQFTYNGEPAEGYENDTIASALYASGVTTFRKSIDLKRPRGFFCAIGNCSSCAMEVDGVANVRTCIIPLKEGMSVKTQDAYPMPKDIDRKVDAPLFLETDVAVIGGGPAGLKAALAAADMGAAVTILDRNYMLGGQLLKQTHKFFGSEAYYAGVRGTDIARIFIEKIREHKRIDVLVNASVDAFRENKSLQINMDHGRRLANLKYGKAIVACGANEAMVNVENNDLPGVYGAGAIQTLVNVYGIEVGKNVLVIGAGNVGLILAYHLLQAGIKVAGVVEALPKISGFVVHAKKIARRGVPIFTSHALCFIEGKDRVEAANIVALDENCNAVPGSEKRFSIDTVALAVGLQPDYRIGYQKGCVHKFTPELCGFVPLRNPSMQTTEEDVYVAGDCTGIEEATTAMMEGELAGIRAAFDLGYTSKEAPARMEELRATMGQFRTSDKGQAIKKGIEKVTLDEK